MNYPSARSYRRLMNRSIRTLGVALLAASLLLGLIPPPLVTTVADLTGFGNLSGLADALPEPAVALAQTTVFSADFENTTGDNNWTLVGGSIDGNWEIGNSQQSSYTGGIIQLEPYAGSGALVTGLSGNSSGSNDTDGTSIARSPTFTIPANAAGAEFTAYAFLGHSGDAETGDSIVVDVYRAADDVKIGTVINEIATENDNRILVPSAANNGYTFYSSSMDAFIGIPVYFQAESIDIGETSFSIVESGLDNIVVTAEAPVTGQFSGTVYEDTSQNGLLDTGESGMSGVVVTVYDTAGTVAGTDTTDANGDYTITGLTDGTQYRLEFTSLPAGYAAGPFGDQSSTVTAFASPPELVRLGLTTQAATCDPSNARYFVSCFINGDPSDSSNVEETGVAGFSYLTSGFVQSTDSDNTYSKISNMGATGPVWGLAYDDTTGKLYSSAVVKRHVGAGPDGIGAIYVHEDLTDQNGATLFHDFGTDAGTIDNNPTRMPGSGTGFGQEGPCKSCDNIDPDAFGWAGRTGFGDIDISADGSTLYVINLNDRKLYSINTSGTPAHTEVAGAPWLDNAVCPDNGNGSDSGVARPWAVTVNAGSVYVGAVCDASASDSCGATGQCDHLGAVVYEWDGATWTTAMPLGLLNYSRDLYRDGGAGDYWHPWAASYADIRSYVRNQTDAQYPQPILADIEFADDGHMILGFISLSGLQFGYNAPAPDSGSGDISIRHFTAGDILRATESGGTYTLETSPEFYDDGWSIASSGRSNDTGAGGLAVLPGTNDVVYGTSDTLSAFSGGVIFFDTTDGSRLAGQEVYQSSSNPNDGSFAKAGGLGDIEMICAPSTNAIEVGSRIWVDDDEDGVQDPGESGLSNVPVTLDCGNGTVTTTTATDNADTPQDETGQYIFSNAGGGNAITELVANTSCTISVDLSDASVGGRAVTSGTSATNDEHDNDAVETGGQAQITFTTPLFGSDHSQDIGLVTSRGSITIVLDSSPDDPQDFDFGGTNVPTTTFTLDDDADGTLSNQSVFSDLSDGSFTFSQTPVSGWDLSSLVCTGATNSTIDIGSDADTAYNAGDTQVSITLLDSENLVCTFTNTRLQDFGDLPDTGTGSTTANGDYNTSDALAASHPISSTLYLGDCIDTESNGQPNVTATGDDTNSAGAALSTAGTCATAGDDEDGVVFTTPLIPDATRTDEGCVDITASAAANIYGWIDWNADGDLTGAGEAVVSGTTTGGGAVDTFCFDVPDTTTHAGTLYARFRLSSDTSGNTPTGAATDGEVEDYRLQLACVGNYVWLDTGATVNVQDGTDTAVNGSAINLIWGGPDGVIGTGSDDVTYTDTTDGNGEYHFCGLLADPNSDGDDEYQLAVPTLPAGALQPVTANQGGDDALDSDGTAGTNASETGTFTVSLPISTTDDAGNDDGQPEGYPDTQDDMSFDFGFAVGDYGDLPDAGNGTGAGDYNTDDTDAAVHPTDPSLYLGDCVDAEADGQPSAAADGDDNNDDGAALGTAGTCASAGDDEDGVAFTTPLIPDSARADEGCVDITASAAGNVYGWIDWNANGDFTDTGEDVVSGAATGGGTADTFCFDVPDSTTHAGTLYARFRLSSDTSANTPIGVATDGEVEDYRIQLVCAGNYVWIDDGTSNNTQDVGDTPASGTTVNLIWGGPDGAVDGTDDVTYTDTTDASGAYHFCGLIEDPNEDGDDEYQVVIPTAPAGTSNPVTADQGGDDALDSDGTAGGANVAEGPTFTVTVPLDAAVVDDAFAVGEPGYDDGRPESYPDNQDDMRYDFGFVRPADWGDLPDTFDTLDAANGARHVISPTLYLGDCVDAELNGVPNAEAGMGAITAGDDAAVGTDIQGTCTGNDDEDGVTLVTPLIPGSTACVDVNAVNNTGANAILQGWIDFDGDGQFDGDADDALTFDTTGTVADNGGTAAVTQHCFTVPAGATFDGGETHMRFRLSAAGGQAFNNKADDGEVEDYWQPLACVGSYVWDDSTGTTDNQQDGTDNGLGSIDVRLAWAGPDDTLDSAATDATAQNDDVFYTVQTTAAGVYEICGLVPDAADTYRIDIPAAPGAANLAVTPDQAGGDDTLDSDGVQSAAGAAIAGPTFQINDPIALTTGESGNGDTPGQLPTTATDKYPDAQDELTFDFGFRPLPVDMGDLPDTFDTTTTESGPTHVVTDTLYLGDCIDAELDGLPDAEAGMGTVAAGDDAAIGTDVTGACADTDDEDGVTLVTPLIPGGNACLEVSAVNGTGAAAVLNGWIDFNGDGDFDGDADEALSFTSIGGAAVAATSDAAVAAGGINAVQYCFTVPAGATFDGGETHMRFRLSVEGGLSFNGSATEGEVEDYWQPLACVGNLVWLDSNSGTAANDRNGVQDAGEVGINGIGVNLIWAGADNSLLTAADNVTYTVTTANDGTTDGIYHFCGLTPDAADAYRIDVPTPPTSAPVATISTGGDENTDSDGAQAAGVGASVTGPTFQITDPIAQTTGENGTGDAPGALAENFPDAQDELTIDFGFVAPQDWGDAPDTFETSNAADGPRHPVVSDLYLGGCVDTEDDGAPDAFSGMGAVAAGDDAAAGTSTVGTCATVNDDEDGVALVTPLMANEEACIEVTANAPANAVLNGWIDFDGDGVFTVAEALSFTSIGGVAVAASTDGNVPLGAATQEYCFTVPAGATFDGGETHMRFRLSTAGGLSWDAAAPDDGEVEDYWQPLACVGNYVWNDANGDGDQDAGEAGLNGIGVDLVWLGPDGTAAGGDDITFSTTTANDGATDGMYHFCGLLPNSAYRIDIPTVPTLYPEITDLDAPGDDTLDSDGTQAGGSGTAVSSPVFTTTAASDISIPTLPAGEAGTGDTPGALTENYPDVQDDLTFDFGFVAYDYGDLPDGTSSPANTYLTLLADDGARHILDGVTYLGNCVDSEADGAPFNEAGQGATAGGDDDAASTGTFGTCATANDDEDGVTFTTSMIPGEQACVDVKASAASVLNGWIDFNGNGILEEGVERVFTDLALAAGANTAPTTCFTVPAGADAAGLTDPERELYSRFRVTANAAEGGDAVTGEAASGEVEDYWQPYLCLGNQVWEDVDNSGVLDGAEVGINGVVVNLFADSNGDGVYDAGDTQLSTATTANNGTIDGAYEFCGLLPSDDPNGTDYIVQVDAGNFAATFPLENMLSSTGAGVGGDPDTDEDDLDDNGAPDVVDGSSTVSPAVTLTDEGEPTTEDGDNDTNLTVDFGFYQPVDFGDLPDGSAAPANTYLTTLADDGARHDIDGVTYLGNCVDGEVDGTPVTEAGLGAGAGGDDGAAGEATFGTCATANDDEDGVTFTTSMIPGEQACVDVTASAASVLNGWIDFNGNGILEEGVERVFTDLALAAGANTTPTTCFAVPAGADAAGITDPERELYSRFRVTANAAEGGDTPTGAAITGEVEDYWQPYLCLGNQVWEDVNNSGALDGAELGINGVVVNLFADTNGDGVYDVGDTQLSTATTANNGAIDGAYEFCGLLPSDDPNGTDYIVQVDAGNFAATFPLENMLSSTGASVGGDPDTDEDDLDDNGAPDAVDGSSTVSPAVTLTDEGEPTGEDGDNDTNLTVDFGFYQPVDFGDLPDGSASPTNTYLTTLADDGARHDIDGVTYLGNCVDAEVDGTPVTEAGLGAGAGGDDGTAGEATFGTCATANDDEDGIIFDTHMLPGEQACVDVTASAASVLNGWIDFNGNGTLDEGVERVFTVQALVAGANNDLCFAVPTDVDAAAIISPTYELYSRFRVTANAAEGGDAPTGAAITGEVEDYWRPYVCVGNQVWNDRDNSGLLDNGEVGIDGVVVNLYEDTNGDGVYDAGDILLETATTATVGANQGIFEFCGLLPSDDPNGSEYILQVDANNFAAGQLLVGYQSSDGNGVAPDADTTSLDSDDNGEPDALGTGSLVAQAVTVTNDSEPTADDGSTDTEFTVDFGVYLPRFDLAVRKTTVTPGTYQPGQNIVFDIELINQGEVTATNVVLVDYIQPGLTFNQALNPGWSADANPLLTVAGPINAAGNAGDSVTVQITLTVDAGTEGQTLDSYVEISDDNAPEGNADVDSTPDAGTNGDGLGNNEPVDGVLIDDEVNNTPTDPTNPDEDDHDIEQITIPANPYDLSLITQIGTPGPYDVGQNVTFTIQIENQGLFSVTNPVIVNYVQPEFTFDPGLNPGWSADVNAPTITVPGDLVPNGTASVQITLTVNPGVEGQTILNFAEISDDQIPAANVDFDSTPNAGTNGDGLGNNEYTPGDPYAQVDPGVDATVDDVVDNTGGDEDDHDIAAILIRSQDFGDLPDASAGNTYPATVADSGAVHNIDGVTYLGACVDAELDGTPQINAGVLTGGDDGTVGTTAGVCAVGTDGALDDEDGVTFTTSLIPGETACVDVMASAAGFLNGWIDFDGSGTLDAGEQIFSDLTLAAGVNTTPTTCFTVPSGVAAAGIISPTHELYSRFRFTALDTDGGNTPTGEALTGEVEDYWQPTLCLGNQVWDDINNDGLLNGTEAGVNGVVVNLYQDNGSGAFDAADILLASTNTANDPLTGSIDGAYEFCGLMPSDVAGIGDYIVQIDANNFAAGLPLENYQSSTGNGAAPDADANLTDSDDNGDPDLVDGASIVSLPVTLTDNAEPTTEDGDADTEFTVDFGVYLPLDYGDLPDASAGSTYSTTLAADGARHVFDYVTYLGACVDSEADGAPQINTGVLTGGDDGTLGQFTQGVCAVGTDGANDDEDGVTFTTSLIPGETTCVDVTASAASFLNGWIDFDGDGALETGERIFTDLALAAGLNTTPNTCFIVPTGVAAAAIISPTHELYSRFRVTALTGEGGDAPSGLADTGEVEDYWQPTLCLGNMVWDDIDNDGTLNGAETGINDVVVNLYQDDGSGAFDAADILLASTTTANDPLTGSIDGAYEFCGLLPSDVAGIGEYIVQVDANNFAVGQPLEDYQSSTGNGAAPDVDANPTDSDDNGDPDLVDGASIVSLPVTLTDNVEPTTEDGDADTEFTVDFGVYLPLDYGDLPDTSIGNTYSTTLAADGARHVFDYATYLGACVDAEVDGIPQLNAGILTVGDDGAAGLFPQGICAVGTDGANDDEDGVTFTTHLIPGETVCVDVTASAASILNGWIDFDGDGVLETGERVFTDVALAAGVNTTPNTCFTVPTGVDAAAIISPTHDLYSRFRVTALSGEGGDAPTGLATTGEVEDYWQPTLCLGNQVWHDVDNSGDITGAEVGIDGVLVNLYADTNADGVYDVGDTLIISGTTATVGVDAGIYEFCGLLPSDDPNGSDYIVQIDAANFTVGQPLENFLSSTGPNVGDDPDIDEDDNDDNGDPDLVDGASLVSLAVTLTDNGEPTTEDGDADTNLTLDFGVFQPVDYGDLPDASVAISYTYPTSLTVDGARHNIDFITYLGACVDAEVDGQPQLSAGLLTGGDDGVVGATAGVCAIGTDGILDDEDGIAFVTSMIPGEEACVDVTAGSAGLLNGWIDFDGSGTLDAAEQVFADLVIAAAGTTQQCFTVPTGVAASALTTDDEVYSRFRFTNDIEDGGDVATGLAETGEVEDYWQPLYCLQTQIWEDANNTGLVDTAGPLNLDEVGINDVLVNLYQDSNGDNTFDIGDTLLITGTTAPLGPDAGLVEFCGLLPGDYLVQVPQENFDAGQPLLNFVSSTGNGTAPDPDDTVDNDDNGDPEAGGAGTVSQALTLTSTNGTLDMGFYQPLDYGDLPDASTDPSGMYPTTEADDGPRHVIDTITYLGSCVDAELDGLPEAFAGYATSGDDGSAGGATGTCAVGTDGALDDEDGIDFVTNMIPGEQACIDITSGSPGVLNGWIDFDGNGSLDASERVFSDLAFAAAETRQECFSVPTGTAAAALTSGDYAVYSRFRFTANTAEGGDSPTGIATTGEVEDYWQPYVCLGNQVWEDLNNSGDIDNGEEGIAGVTVDLYQDDGDSAGIYDANDTLLATTLTEGDGFYEFCGLHSSDEVGDYIVQIDATDFILGNILYGHVSSFGPNVGDDPDSDPTDSDDNGEPDDPNAGPAGTSISSAAITLTPNNEPTDEDGSADTNFTVDFGLFPVVTDYGDLPDSFDTTLAITGAVHTITSTLYLGGCVDTEVDGLVDSNNFAGVDGTEGDDNIPGFDVAGVCNDPARDDEDGVKLSAPLIPGFEACVQIDAVNDTGADAVFQGWIDFNGDGDYDGDANEELVFTNNGIVPNGGVSGAEYCFTVPSDATFDGGETHLRYRLSVEGGLSWNGAAATGEVEDYYYALSCIGSLVWVDGDEEGDQDEVGAGYPNLELNLVWYGLDDTLGTADDRIYDKLTGSQGEYHFCGLLAKDENGNGGIYRMEIPTPPPSNPRRTRPNEPFGDDLDSDGYQPGGFGAIIYTEMFMVEAPDYAGATPYSLPENESGIGDDIVIPGNFPDSSVDQTIDLGLDPADWGDLPDTDSGVGSFATTFDDGGEGFPALHTVVSELRFGDCVDTELGGQPDTDGRAGMDGTEGDDNSPGQGRKGTCTSADVDDEDGVQLLTPLIPGGQSCVEVSTFVPLTGTAVLNAFIDFNGDGDFLNDADEQLVFNQIDGASIVPSTEGAIPNGQSTQRFCFDVPSDATFDGGETHLRYRLSSAGSLLADGLAQDGEVEDYWQPLVCVGNYVWDDTGSVGGIQDDGDVPLENVELTLMWGGFDGLLGTADDMSYTTTSDSQGLYHFCGLVDDPQGDGADEYQISVNPSLGTKTLVAAQLGANEALDSDVDTAGRSAVFTVSTPLTVADNAPNDSRLNTFPDTQDNLAIDIGFGQLVSIGNYVWEDTDGDGIQDEGEPALAGATVLLLDANGDTVDMATTAADGFYNFGDLSRGDYSVRVTPPSGYVASPVPTDPDPDSNSANNDSNGVITPSGAGAESPLFSLQAGTEPIGDTDDQDDPFGLTDRDNNLTIDFGFFRTTGLGDLVWQDLNGNGVQDTGEPGLAGVMVTLLDSDGDEVDQRVTDSAGAFGFTELAPGDYTLVFTQPAGYRPAPAELGTDSAIDSNADEVTGRTQTISLSTGEFDDSLDAGFVPDLRLGGSVWQDADNDGQLEAGEEGLPGVILQLFNAGDDPTTETALDTAESGTDGSYLFPGLPAGAYFVYIATPDSVFSRSSTDTDTADNGEDNDDNGSQPNGPGTPVQSPTITVAAGTEPTTDGDDSDGDLTIDFGFHNLSTIGNFVWIDENQDGIKDVDEPIIADVVVILFDADGNEQSRTVSGTDGTFLFEGVSPGTYYLGFIAPSGFTFTDQTVQRGNPDDSDVAKDTGETPLFTIEGGSVDLSWSAGLVRIPTALDEVNEPGEESFSIELFLPILMR